MAEDCVVLFYVGHHNNGEIINQTFRVLVLSVQKFSNLETGSCQGPRIIPLDVIPYYMIFTKKNNPDDSQIIRFFYAPSPSSSSADAVNIWINFPESIFPLPSIVI